MDNSLAIHPDQYAGSGGTGGQWTDIGEVRTYRREGRIIRLSCEGGEVAIQFYTEKIARVVMNPAGEPELGWNPHVLVLEPEDVQVTAAESEHDIELATGGLTVRIRKSPLRISFYDAEGREFAADGERGMGSGPRGEVACTKKTGDSDRFYGFGEKAGFLNKRGEKLTMWNTDVYAPHNPETDPLYVSIPFYLTLRNDGRASGLFFFNTFRTTFDLRGESEHSLLAEGGQLDYFVFASPTPKDVIAQYTSLTGRAPLPPRWALGYHQSRYSYETEAEVRELVATFKEKGIPLDVVYLDIHYMDGYRVFTFDKGRFPNPRKLIEDLRAEGIRVVPIVDPGVKADPAYRVFSEGVRHGRFCRYLDGQLFYGQVWPERSAFPDFTDASVREWWGDLHSFYTELGIEGVWNDMNEPSVFNESKTMDLDVVHQNDGRPATHRELHNVYGSLMSGATYEGLKRRLGGKRPFVLTRSAYAGIQRFAAVWTGDNRSFWEHLELCVPMCLNLGLSGVPLCGADVGGFAHDSNGELLARWTQLGAFMPYFRNHSELKSIRQEPWSFGAGTEEIVRRYVKLRYRWLPYLYGLFEEASRTGLPVMRPLLLEYPDDEQALAVNDQFLLGTDVLVAPVVRPGQTKRMVYLPAGAWVDYWTDERLEGGRHVIVDAPLDTLPLFVREGAIVPLASERMSTETEAEELALHLYPSTAGLPSEYSLYEDDGRTFSYAEGGVYEERVRATPSSPNRLDVDIRIVRDGYAPGWQRRTLVIHHAPAGLQVFLNGSELAPESRTGGTATYRL